MRTTCLSVIGLLGVLSAGCGGSTDDGGLNGTGAQAGTGGATGGTGGGSGSGGATGGSGGATGGAGGAVGGAGGSSGGSGGGGGAPECTDATQCKLFSDCCTCQALGPNEPEPPVCPAACIQDMCSALGVSQSDLACTAGSCVAGIQCTGATCESIPPTCDPGEVPSVSGSCWGSCVPANQCASVTSCVQCTGTLETCVMIENQTGDGPSSHCVDIPKGCEGTPDCACMGGMVCPAPFDTCTDFSGVKGMSCSCPNC